MYSILYVCTNVCIFIHVLIMYIVLYVYHVEDAWKNIFLKNYLENILFYTT
jgi:hypothetical protein